MLTLVLKGLYKTTKGVSASVMINIFVFLFFIKIKLCLRVSHKWDIKSSATLIINSYKLFLQSQV